MASQPLKAEKPKLPQLYRQLLEEKDYTLRVEITIQGDYNHDSDRTVGYFVLGTIRVGFWNDEQDDLDFIDIGKIHGWRILTLSLDEAQDWSDRVSQDLYNAIDWLMNRQTEFDPEDVLFDPPLFLELVKLEPMWRGQGLALPAVATYLDLLACSFVFFQPAPLGVRELSPADRKRAIQRLKQYWQKLGFNYDSQRNMMWILGWSCPEWLRAEREQD